MKILYNNQYNKSPLNINLHNKNKQKFMRNMNVHKQKSLLNNLYKKK